MEIFTEVSVGDVISAISVVLVFFGGIIGLIQWNKSVRIKKAEYIYQLIEKIRADEDIRDVVYQIDYGESWYNKDFHGSEIERKVDRTLSYFSYICYLKETKLIGTNEFHFFKYDIERIIHNKDVQAYLFNLFHFSKKCKTPLSFISLFNYGKKVKGFTPSFFDSSSLEYPHFLVF